MMVSDFRDILSFVRNERAHIEGDIYIGSKFLITRNCNSFFKPLLDNNYPVKANVARIAMVKKGWCEPTIGYRSIIVSPVICCLLTGELRLMVMPSVMIRLLMALR